MPIIPMAMPMIRSSIGKWASQLGGLQDTRIVTARAPCDGLGVARCPSGYKVVGGGIISREWYGTCNGGGGAIYWIGSFPYGNGWACGVDDYMPTCYAVCVK